MHLTKDGVEFKPGMVLWCADSGLPQGRRTNDWYLDGNYYRKPPWDFVALIHEYYSSLEACVMAMIHSETIAYQRRMKELQACLEHPDCCSK
jgi:hypothetical protein